MIRQCSRQSIRFVAVSTFVFANSAAANALEIVCEWQITDPKYQVVFEIDQESGEISRSDSERIDQLLKITDQGIWMASKSENAHVLAVQTIERSSKGGNWSDVWLMADGQANEVTGGYCVEAGS